MRLLRNRGGGERDVALCTAENLSRGAARVTRRVASALALTAALALAAACGSYTTIPDADRERINKAHDGKMLYLKQSLYVGPFYDDNRFELLHPRKFEELTYLSTNEGDPIRPPSATGIVPAGTRVRIERIEWPTGDAVFRRPLYTPRYTTWIYMRVGRDRGDTTLERDGRQILLLPSGIRDEKSFNQWLEQAVSESDVNPWLRSLPRDQQLGVVQKHAVVGMSYEALIAALGYPDRITRRMVQDGGPARTLEIAIYGAESVVLDNGVVARVDDPTGRPVRAPEATPAPATSSPPPDAPPPAAAPPAGDPPPDVVVPPASEPGG